MKKIEICEEDYERIREIADKFYLWPWEVIQALLESIDEDDEESIFG